MTSHRFNETPGTPYAVLDATDAQPPDQPRMSGQAVLDAFGWMVLARVFDERATSLQRQGRFGTFSSVKGQEASIMGSASALDPGRDWIVPQYRELPALLRHGYPLENFALYFMGHPAGGRIPDDVRVLPIQISLAAQIPHAVGLGHGLRSQGSDAVAITYFGDGASSEGDFHEALNLAGVWKAPIIFFLQNNGWAISTPREKQTAASTFAQRAPGYGVEGVLVDGNDLLAVFDVAAAAVERARAGGGPTLIESVTWRAGAHNTADDPTRYVDPLESEAWASKDPVDRTEQYLRLIGLLDDARVAVLRTECVAEVDRAIGVALATPPAESDALFDQVYATMPPRLVKQQVEHRARGEARKP